MAAILVWVRREWHRRMFGLLGLAAVIAAVGGVTLGVVCGARRASSSFDRWQHSTHAGTVDVQVNDPERLDPTFTDRLPSPEALASAIERVPGVRGVRTYSWVGAAPAVDDNFFQAARGASAGLAPTTRVIAGRAPRPDAPDEVMVNEAARKAWDAPVGRTLHMLTLAPDQLGGFIGQVREDPKGPALSLKVVGVFRDVEDISDAPEPIFMAGPGFVPHYGSQVMHVLGNAQVNVQPGAERSVIEALNRTLPARYTAGPVSDDFAGRVRETIDVEVTTLTVFAVLAGLAGAIVLWQTLVRHGSPSAGDRQNLSALGFTPRGRTLATTLAAAPALAAGLVGAVAVAVVVSPLFPRGLARRAEPHPGIRIDRSALVLGALTLAILLPVLALVSAWVSSRRSAAPASGRARVGAFERLFSSLPTVPSLGARFALGRDRRGVAVGLAGVAGAAFLVAGFVAVSTVLASRDLLFHDTRLFGAGWDLEMSTSDPADAAIVQRLGADPGVATVGTRTELVGNGGEITARGPKGTFAVTPFTDTIVKGSLPFSISSGRPPGDGEVLIGRKVADNLGLRADDTLTAEGFNGPVQLGVSGLFVHAGDDELDQGFAMTLATLDRLRNTCPAGSDRLDCQVTTLGAAVKLRSGADERATVARLSRIAPGLVPTPLPSIVGNLGQIGSTPWLLAAFLAIIGAAGLAHALIVGLQRRRRELAVTRALGLRPRQARQVIGCQALTMGILGAILGLAVGAGVGRLIWQRVAGGIGAVIAVQVPLRALVIAPLVAVCLGLGLALVTGRSAAALRPVDLLRAE